jgi:hypothetical protein
MNLADGFCIWEDMSLSPSGAEVSACTSFRSTVLGSRVGKQYAPFVGDWLGKVIRIVRRGCKHTAGTGTLILAEMCVVRVQEEKRVAFIRLVSRVSSYEAYLRPRSTSNALGLKRMVLCHKIQRDLAQIGVISGGSLRLLTAKAPEDRRTDSMVTRPPPRLFGSTVCRLLVSDSWLPYPRLRTDLAHRCLEIRIIGT